MRKSIKHKLLFSSVLILSSTLPISMLAISCTNELSQEEVEKQTLVTVETSKITIDDFDYEKHVSLTLPNNHKLVDHNVQKNKTNNEVTLTLKILNDKTKKEYKIIKTITNFKKANEELTFDKNDAIIKLYIGENELLSDQFKNHFVSEFKKENVKITSKKNKYQYEFNFSSDNKTGKIILNITQKNGEKTLGNFDHEFTGFKIQEEIVFDESDAIIKIFKEETEIKESDYKNYNAEDINHDDFKIESKDGKRQYEWTLESNNQMGTITLEIQQKNGEVVLGKFNKTFSGFKIKLAADREDLDVAIEGLDPNQYNTKYSTQIFESKIKLSSKNGKFEYELISLSPGEDGELKVTYKQFDKNGHQYIEKNSKIISGFKKAVFDNADAVLLGAKTAEERAKVKPSETNNDNWVFSVKSNSKYYEYKLLETIRNDEAGTITFKFEMYYKTKLLGKSEIVADGFKK